MTNKERKDFIENFVHLWEQKAPELRFMQLICNFQAWWGNNGFYIPDEKLTEKLKEYLDSITREG